MGLVFCREDSIIERKKGELCVVALTSCICHRLTCLSCRRKIVWPEAWSASEQNFLYTVDGVHCRTNEIIHPTLAKNTKLYSHKFNQAGFDYELAISIFDDALVWINGPFLGSKHDITIFREDGLKETTPQGKKGIADKGYRGEKGILCTPNSQDTVALRKFKVSMIGLFYF